MSRIGEAVLRKFCRPVTDGDFLHAGYEAKHADPQVYARDLEAHFPTIRQEIREQRVLDIGCAEGMECVALSMLGAREVVGIDIRINRELNEQIRQQHGGRRITYQLQDAARTTFDDEEFDMVVTCGSFEHFADPFAVLKEAVRVVQPGGRIYLTSGVWLHPYGAHMNFFTHFPWVHLVFSEATIMAVRNDYRQDGAKRYHEVEGGLNKVGVESFLAMCKALDLKLDRLYLNPMKQIRPLVAIPYVRELFCNLIVAELVTPERKPFFSVTSTAKAYVRVGPMRSINAVSAPTR